MSRSIGVTNLKDRTSKARMSDRDKIKKREKLIKNEKREQAFGAIKTQNRSAHLFGQFFFCRISETIVF